MYIVKINEDSQMRTNRSNFFRACYKIRELATIICVWQKIKDKQGNGKMIEENSEGLRVCSDWGFAGIEKLVVG